MKRVARAFLLIVVVTVMSAGMFNAAAAMSNRPAPKLVPIFDYGHCQRYRDQPEISCINPIVGYERADGYRPVR